MTGRLKDLMFGKDGKQILMIELNADFRTAYDELKNEELEISIKSSIRSVLLMQTPIAGLCVMRLLNVYPMKSKRTQKKIYTELR